MSADVVVLDYGSGNVRRAVRALGLREVRLIGTPDDADALAEAGIRIAGLITT